MDVPLHTYEPFNQHFELIWVALSIFVIGAVGTIWLFRQKPSTGGGSAYTGLLGMLIGFISLIALGTGIFGWFAMAKITTVSIYADKIAFGTQQIPYQNLENAVIELSQETSWINPNITKKSVQLLFVADKQGNTYVLSEENYPIKEVMTNLKAAVAKWESTSSIK